MYLHLQETNLSSHLRIVLYVMIACLFVLQELSTLSRGLYDAWPFKSSNSTEDSFVLQPSKTGSMLTCLASRFPSTFNPLSQATTFRYVCRRRPKAVSITSAMSWRFQVSRPPLHAHKNSDHEMTTEDQYIAVIPDLFAPRIQQHLKVF